VKKLMLELSNGTLRLDLDHLEVSEIERLRRANAIVTDPSRRRPRYFDGRFLAAPDLIREQAYFIARQADLAKSAGFGVIHGLTVAWVEGNTIRIDAGNGITPAGEIVVLTESRTINLADAVESQRLDTAFGLDRIPNQSPRRRSGLFVLAARPVEYTANPLSAYPAAITARRAVEDGEIIEALAITLVPYQDEQTELDPVQQRAHAARRVFVERRPAGVPAEALPLAMLQFDGGSLRWLDMHMVRREIGPEHGGVAGFGPVPRAVREAHVLHHNAFLDAVIDLRTRRGAPPFRFAASEAFRALPPAGLMPIDTIERLGVARYTQLFFPPQTHVLMSLVPEDEVAAQVDESLLLPPIDLTASSDQHGFTWVLVLLPAPRSELLTPQQTRAVELSPATPGIVARGLSFEALGRLFPRSTSAPAPVPTAGSPAEQHEAPLRTIFTRLRDAHAKVWYVRRRSLRVKAEHRYEVKHIDIGEP
jgi:hypothetical protein